MTLAEIKQLNKDFLTVAEVAGCLHMDPQLIRDQCEKDIKWLGFPACRCGHSFRFPREGFIAWATGNMPLLVYNTWNNRIGCPIDLDAETRWLIEDVARERC